MFAFHSRWTLVLLFVEEYFIAWRVRQRDEVDEIPLACVRI